ncbi:MAG: hypothetical protein JSW67_13025, partial [Candidatus Latescibacterota bacterium]
MQWIQFRTRNSWSSVLFVGLGILYSLTGCSPKIASQTAFMKERGVEMTAHELRVRNYILAEYFAARVEESADQILEASSDSAVREDAILWKMHAIPAMQAASFFGDPLGALGSEVIFCVQMRQYFDDGYGKDVFGEQQDVAVATSVELEEAAYAAAELALPSADMDTIRVRIDRFAAANPIRSPRFKRSSDDPVLSRAFTEDTTVGGLRAASAMTEQMRDLSDRMALLTDYGPRQARWQVQYLREQVPGMAATARDTVLAGLFPVMDEFMRFMDLQRGLGFDLAQAERQVILETMASERLAATDLLVKERQAVF